MDPWRDCERFFDPHFADRMSERFLPVEQVRDALKDGNKIKRKNDDYEVKWKKWTLLVSMGSCFLYMWTAYSEP